MKRATTFLYLGAIVLCLLFFIRSGLFMELDVFKKTKAEGYRVLTDYEYRKVNDGSAPCGIRENYYFNIDKASSSYRELVFYTIHQNVEIYVGDECVYRMHPARQNRVGKSPGCVWNRISLDAEDVDDRICVSVTPVYKSSVGIKPEFYYGELYAISKKIFFGGLPVLLLCLIGIGTGAVYIFYTLYNYGNEELDRSMLMLGFFALAFSFWKLTDAAATKYLFPDFKILYIAPFLFLHLISVPFAMFIKELLSSREKKIWYFAVWFNIAALAVSLFLQFTNIKDLRQSLFLTHIGMSLIVAVTVVMVIYEIRVMGWNEKLRRNVIFIGVCFVSFFMDIVIYYVSKGTVSTPFSMLGALVYVFAAGAFTLRDARELMHIGMEARNFERKAYHDQLTGLFNRTAYAEYTGRDTFVPDQCIVAVFDLNNLKKCNDTLGHEKGDIYIKECAAMINETFSDIGKCYRMGGDEFCVLIEHTSLNVCKQRMKKLQETVKERNKKNPEIHMGIAAGYERYDKRMDYDINDTSKRADKMMYAEKIAMKQAENA